MVLVPFTTVNMMTKIHKICIFQKLLIKNQHNSIYYCDLRPNHQFPPAQFNFPKGPTKVDNMVESGGLCDWQTINWLELHIWVINEYLVGTRWPPQMVPGSDIDALHPRHHQDMPIGSLQGKN